MFNCLNLTNLMSTITFSYKSVTAVMRVFRDPIDLLRILKFKQNNIKISLTLQFTTAYQFSILNILKFTLVNILGILNNKRAQNIKLK